MKALKSLLQDRFERESLSDDQLARLQARLQSHKTGPVTTSSWPIRRVAVVAVLAFLGGILLMQFQRPAEISLAERIATEVVYQHMKAKPLDFKANSIAEAVAPIAALGFQPIGSTMLAQLDENLLGGRQCSLQGAPAAQLRLKGKGQGHRTLYQVPYQEDLFGRLPDVDSGQSPLLLYAKGVPVHVWKERGMVLVLVGDF